MAEPDPKRIRSEPEHEPKRTSEASAPMFVMGVNNAVGTMVRAAAHAVLCAIYHPSGRNTLARTWRTYRALIDLGHSSYEGLFETPAERAVLECKDATKLPELVYACLPAQNPYTEHFSAEYFRELLADVEAYQRLTEEIDDDRMAEFREHMQAWIDGKYWPEPTIPVGGPARTEFNQKCFVAQCEVMVYGQARERERLEAFARKYPGRTYIVVDWEPTLTPAGWP